MVFWKTIQNAFARILYTSRHSNNAEYTAQLNIMKTTWDGFSSQLFSTWGEVRNMREIILYIYYVYSYFHIND